MVSATLKGYDNFDADACARHGTWLTILPDLLTVPAAELAVGLVIGIMRRVAEADRHVRSGAFAGWRPRFYGAALHGATAGIAGMGRLGQAVAGRLAGYVADVFAMEDWARADRPAAIPARLLAHPRTLFTPHLGSAVDEVRRQMSLAAARQVRQVLDGQRPEHAVNEPRR